MSGKTKASSTPINIIKDGVVLSGTKLANAVNDHFLSINADLPPLDLKSLPAYLPAPQPVPIITPYEVCHKLLEVKPFKSHGLDGIPNRVIKEFAYELAEPVCTIFNESLSSGIVPVDWKDASITPIPKTHFVCCEDELRPIALTACLSNTSILS